MQWPNLYVQRLSLSMQEGAIVRSQESVGREHG